MTKVEGKFEKKKHFENFKNITENTESLSPKFEENFNKNIEKSQPEEDEFRVSQIPKLKSLFLNTDEISKCIKSELEALVSGVLCEKLDEIKQTVHSLKSDFLSRFSELELQNKDLIEENRSLRDEVGELKMLFNKRSLNGRGVGRPFTVGWGM
jgi:hypothetical protein